MGRNLQLKSMMFIFSLIALLSMSACAVASSPAPDDDLDEQAGSEVQEPSPTPEIEPESELEAIPQEGRETPEDDRESGSTTSSSLPDPNPSSERGSDDDIDTPGTANGDRSQSSDKDASEEGTPASPVRMQIDAIDVDAGFEFVGKTDEGNMDVPQEWENVAWYEPGTVPGDRGNAVVAGHYDSETGPAVFIDLNELSSGDEIQIETEDGETLVFEVTEVESVHVDDADTKKIFGASDERNLNLITCEGVWDSSARMYDQRLIVYSTLVSE